MHGNPERILGERKACIVKIRLSIYVILSEPINMNNENPNKTSGGNHTLTILQSYPLVVHRERRVPRRCKIKYC